MAQLTQSKRRLSKDVKSNVTIRRYQIKYDVTHYGTSSETIVHGIVQ